MTRRLLTFLAASFLLAPCQAVSEDAKPVAISVGRGYPPELDDAQAETYKKVGDVELKLYIFNPTDLKLGDKRPAIVFFFGGGWNGGTPSQFENQCRYLASRGMVAITADYRVKSRQGVAAADCVRDAKSAMRYVRANASRLGIDVDKIVASGGSAGGHLAACLGTIKGVEEPGEDITVATVPNAMLLFNPALMFGDPPGIPLTSERTGIDPADISPYHHVKEGQAPTLLLFGSEDSMVPAAQAFERQMKKVGNRCELEIYDGVGHGFFNAGRDEQHKYFRETLKRADVFLESLGFVSGPPTVDTFFE